MSRSRWTPLLFALLAGAAAWLAWRFLPRDWLRLRCGAAPRGAGAAAVAGSAAARVEEPPAAEPARCAALTQGGTRCSREVEPGSSYCWQHGAG